MLVRAPDSRSNGCEFEFWQERRENFLLQSQLVCLFLFGVRSIPVLPQCHVKDPGHSAKSAGGSLLLKTHTPLTQGSRSGLTMLLSRRSVGTYPETSSYATCQGTFGHSRLSLRANYCFKKKKKKGCRLAMNSRTFPRKCSHARKKPPPLHSQCHLL